MPTKTNPALSVNQPRIFLSYARKDGEDFARDLRQKLTDHSFSLWQDRTKMEGAKKWWAQIEEAIKTVEYMVLVVTKAALKSKIVQREWKFARQEGKGVIPVIGSNDLDFDNMPRWMKAQHFVDTTHPEQWTRFLRTLEGPHQSIRVKYVEEKPPDNFIDRPREFEPLLKELVDPVRGEAVAITATLQGAGGFGKTTLARALCHHPNIKDTYFDGIHWVTIGETPGDLTGRVLDLIERISGQRPGFETLERASDRLAELLADHTMLLVIDDVWDPTHLKPFLKCGPNCTRLITTRNKNVVPPNTKSVVVDRMDTDEAVALLKKGLPVGQEDRLTTLAKRLGHWPLLLNLVASALRDECKAGKSVSGAIDYIEEGLREEGLTAFDVSNVEDRNLAVEATINVSLRRLAGSSRERFQELGIFPEDTKIPIRVLEVYWEATGGLTSFQVNKTIRELFGFSLLWAVNLEEQNLQIHDVFRGYLRSKKKNELGTLQNLLLDTWKGNTAWHSLSKTEPYIWHHLAWHLIEAGRQEELGNLLLDFPWLQAKLETTDPAALLKDFEYVNGNDAVEKVSGAVRLSAHILGQDTRQLPSQLVGRLKEVQLPKVQKFLDQVQEYSNHPWLRPLQGSLIAPGGPLIRTLSGHSASPYSKTKCTTLSLCNRRWCMGKNYSHFDHKERTLIYWWRNEHLSLRDMARRLRRSHTSISRELKRNRWCGKEYVPRGAQILSAYRIQHRAQRDRLKSNAVRGYVQQQLRLGWTPELIAGRLKQQGALPSVCHESIYQYIYCVAPDLIPCLPRHHPKRKPKRPYRKTGERIKNRKGLECRPKAATTRRECGHWEADMIVSGDRQQGLNVLVDRKSRLTHISVLENKTAAATKQVMLRRLKRYPAALTQSITYDNGSENTLHEEINEALETQSFFCAPYHSWEKGSVEQVNGLIRRFLPKGTNFHELGQGEINRIEQLLNNRPRKCLHYRTPSEVFREARGALDV